MRMREKNSIFMILLSLCCLHAYICIFHSLLDVQYVTCSVFTNEISSQHIRVHQSLINHLQSFSGCNTHHRYRCIPLSIFSLRTPNETLLLLSSLRSCSSRRRYTSLSSAAPAIATAVAATAPFHMKKAERKAFQARRDGRDKTITSSLCFLRNEDINESKSPTKSCSISVCAPLLQHHLQHPCRRNRGGNRETNRGTNRGARRGTNRGGDIWFPSSPVRQVEAFKQSPLECNTDSTAHKNHISSFSSANDDYRFKRQTGGISGAIENKEQLSISAIDFLQNKTPLDANCRNIKRVRHMSSIHDKRKLLLHITSLSLQRVQKSFRVKASSSSGECSAPLMSSTYTNGRSPPLLHIPPFLHIPSFHISPSRSCRSSSSRKRRISMPCSAAGPMQCDSRCLSSRDYVAGCVLKKLSLTAEKEEEEGRSLLPDADYLLPGCLHIVGLPYCAKVGEIPGDGDCLFMALAASLWYSVFGDHPSLQAPAFKDMTYNLRQLAVETFDHPTVSSFTLEENESVSPAELLRRASETYGLSPAGYLNRLRLPGTWGGGPEIVALSHALKRTICVYEIDFSSQSQNTSPPLGQPSLATRGVRESSYTSSYPAVAPSTATSSNGAEKYQEANTLFPRMSAEALCKGKPLKLVACLGYPTNIGDEPLHILFINSASRLPTTSLAARTTNGDHFMPLFPCLLQSE